MTAKKKPLRAAVLAHALEKHGTEPDYPWPRQYPNYAVLRHGNRKWYGLIMDVPRAKLGLPGEGVVDVLNVKLAGPPPEGTLPAYHMNKDCWASVPLDGTVDAKTVMAMLEGSFLATGGK